MSKVRTRIAPSPTGIPHIGNTRTALFNYLFAKKYGGEFVLRIEDTDQKRLVPGSQEKIYEIFDFLGIQPDEGPITGGTFGPYIQTQRLSIYQKYAQELVSKGTAYHCFCTPEELKTRKGDKSHAGYDKHCLHLTAQEVQEKLQAGAPHVIRINMPQTGYTVWNDLVQGKISIPNQEMDDKVLIKTNGIPTYQLAVVIDDHLMEISHVLRGGEWISSTPIHLKLYEAFGWQVPVHGHLSLLLGSDRTKLSKRHGAKSALEYRDDGYLPEAINNFMLYLGFSYQDNSAVLSLSEMVQIFDEKKIQKQNAVFDIKKLNYFNKQWIKRLPDKDLVNRLKKFVPQEWIINDKDLLKLLPLIKERIWTLKEFADYAKPFFVAPQVSQNDLTAQSEHSTDETKKFLTKVYEDLAKTPDWTSQNLDALLHQTLTGFDWTPKQAFMTIRLAITGSQISPPLFDTLAVLGKTAVLSRIKLVLKP